MGVTASEDKKTLAAQQAKESDLRSKNNAFLSIEKASIPFNQSCPRFFMQLNHVTK
jgi:hypothetical protein